MAETNTTLSSDYTMINIKKQTKSQNKEKRVTLVTVQRMVGRDHVPQAGEWLGGSCSSVAGIS